jgi:predicted ATPase/class 3 adenylate cyclase
LDVTNFTAAAHQLDSEDVYLFINEAMSILTQVVHKYEGTIDKFTGDGLMALFGAPVAHENDPERAIRAGLDMQTAIQPLRQRIKDTYGFDFQVRIGLNTGAAIAGKVGNDVHTEYTVIGDTVNLAARLESAAKPGTVLVSAETYQRTRPLFEFESLPPLTVKGIPQPVQAYRPLALRDKPGPLRGLPGSSVPMVGRAGHLTRLQQAVGQVCQQGQRRIALITGDAGLGKSRLVAELRRTIVRSDVKVYQGGCLAHTHSTPLWLVADLLRDILAIAEGDPADVQTAALTACLTRLDLPVVEILPFLGYVLGLDQTDPDLSAHLRRLEAEMVQQQTHSALRQLLLASAGQAPTVLIFEDLHWVDPASRNFLEYLIQTSPEAPLLLVLVSRAAERQSVIRPLVVAAQQEPERLVDLPLQALSESEGQLLIDQLITQSSPEAQQLKQQIGQRAAGNPFFVEEIIRMLIDQAGLVRPEPAEGWQVTGQAQQLLKAIPGTVKDLILARFDRLPEGLRQLLQKATVLGSVFPTSLLAELDNVNPASLSGYLAELEARQFLQAAPFRAEPGYTFCHALLQEAVYGTLLKRDRRLIHAQVAQAIETSSLWPPEEQSEVLAHHYAESDTPVKAVPYLVLAGEHAERRCAYETAIQHYGRAKTLLPELLNDQSDVYFRARLGLGRSFKFFGEFAAADQILSETLHHVWGWGSATEPAVSWPFMAECLRQLADLRQREGNYEPAITYLEAGLQILGREAVCEAPQLWGVLVDRLAWTRFRQGHLDEASALAQEAVGILNQDGSDDPATLAKLYNTLGGVAWQQGRVNEAINYAEQSLKLYDGVGYLWGTATAYGNLGLLYDVLGDWSRAVDYHQQACALHGKMGSLEGEARSFDNLGILHMIMGQHDPARQEIETSLMIRRRLGDNYGLAQSHASLAHLALVQGDIAEAVKQAETAQVLANSIKSQEVQVYARWILALAQAEQDRLPTAMSLAQQALEMAQSAGLMDQQADCLRALGLIRAASGLVAAAETDLLAALELAETQDDPYRQAQALLTLGQLYQRLAQAYPLDARDWPAEATSALHRAAQRFESLGAAHDLQLAQAALSQLPLEL